MAIKVIILEIFFLVSFRFKWILRLGRKKACGKFHTILFILAHLADGQFHESVSRLLFSVATILMGSNYNSRGHFWPFEI